VEMATVARQGIRAKSIGWCRLGQCTLHKCILEDLIVIFGIGVLM